MFLLGLGIGCAPFIGALIAWKLTEPGTPPMEQVERFRRNEGGLL